MSQAPIELPARVVPLRGSGVARALLRLAGWRLLFDGLPGPRGVAVIYPHTSNWDFIVLMLAKWALGLPVTFWGKDSLFRWPVLGRWLRWTGGLPVARHVSQGAVGQMVQHMQAACDEGRFMWLALSPEGTRGKTAGWRTGFYRLALQTGVPVGLLVLDYGQRRVGIDSFWQLSGDPAADLVTFERRLAGCRGHRPHLAAPVRLLKT